VIANKTMALFVFDTWRREGSAKRCALECHLAALRQCQAITQRAVCTIGLCFACLWCWAWTRRWLIVSWASRFKAGDEHMIIWTGRFILWCSHVRIRVGRFVCFVLII